MSNVLLAYLMAAASLVERNVIERLSPYHYKYRHGLLNCGSIKKS